MEKVIYHKLQKQIFLSQEQTNGEHLLNGLLRIKKIKLCIYIRTAGWNGINQEFRSPTVERSNKCATANIPVIPINRCLTKKMCNSTGRELTWMPINGSLNAGLMYSHLKPIP